MNSIIVTKLKLLHSCFDIIPFGDNSVHLRISKGLGFLGILAFNTSSFFALFAIIMAARIKSDTIFYHFHTAATAQMPSSSLLKIKSIFTYAFTSLAMALLRAFSLF